MTYSTWFPLVLFPENDVFVSVELRARATEEEKAARGSLSSADSLTALSQMRTPAQMTTQREAIQRKRNIELK